MKSAHSRLYVHSADSGTRTHNSIRTGDFKSPAYTSSAISANDWVLPAPSRAALSFQSVACHKTAQKGGLAAWYSTRGSNPEPTGYKPGAQPLSLWSESEP